MRLNYPNFYQLLILARHQKSNLPEYIPKKDLIQYNHSNLYGKIIAIYKEQGIYLLIRFFLWKFGSQWYNLNHRFFSRYIWANPQ